MSKHYKRYRSLLQRKENVRNVRNTIIFSLLTLLLIFLLISLGIPSLVKLAVFIGDIKSSSQPVENNEGIPPPPPRLETVSEATNSARIGIRGYSKPGTTVEIFLDGFTNQKVLAGNDGSFSASDIALSQGRNNLLAKAIDENGQISRDSDELIIYYDTTPPALEITDPLEPNYSTDQSQFTIKGKTEGDATVIINERKIIIGVEGNFQYPAKLSDGENMFNIVAADKAGNKTEKQIIINSSLQ